MSTVEQVRREQLAAYHAARQAQEMIVQDYLIPLVKLAGEKIAVGNQTVKNSGKKIF